jgi:hypothetical protein
VRLVQPQLDDAEINARLVGYCSEQVGQGHDDDASVRQGTGVRLVNGSRTMPILLKVLLIVESVLMQAHSSVEKAGLIGLVKMHLLPADEHFSLRGHTLQEAVEKDRLSGLIPFYVR